MPGLQQAVLGHLGDESASAVVLDCRNGEVLAMATNPVVRSQPVQFRRAAGAMGGVERRQAGAADQQGDARAVCAGLDLQDGGGGGGAGGENAVAERPHQLPRLPGPGRRPVPLLAQGRARIAGPARRPEEQLRRVLLRDGTPHRHRPDRGDGAPVRSGSRSGHRPADSAHRPDPDAGVAHRTGPCRGTSATRSSAASARAISR